MGNFLPRESLHSRAFVLSGGNIVVASDWTTKSASSKSLLSWKPEIKKIIRFSVLWRNFAREWNWTHNLPILCNVNLEMTMKLVRNMIMFLLQRISISFSMKKIKQIILLINSSVLINFYVFISCFQMIKIMVRQIVHS